METNQAEIVQIPKVGDIYQHFKNKTTLYQIIAIASYIHSSVGSLTQNSLLFDSQTLIDCDNTSNPILNGTKMIVYMNLLTNETYVRDLSKWNDQVLYNGVITNRFIKHEKLTKSAATK